MRNRINLILCLIILLFFKGTSLFGQKIIEYKEDTMIVISPHNVMTMNSIIVERNYLEKEVLLLDSLNTLKDSTILEQKQIIKMNEESLLKTNEKNNLIIQELAYNWKRKAWTQSGFFAIGGIIIGVLLAK